MSGFNFLCTVLAMLLLTPFIIIGLGGVIMLIVAIIQGISHLI